MKYYSDFSVESESLLYRQHIQSTRTRVHITIDLNSDLFTCSYHANQDGHCPF